MHLVGWSDVPRGYAASFDVAAAPWWLRLLFNTPIVDRFAYPLLVKRGHGTLSAHPGWPPDQLGQVFGGWRVTRV